MLLEAKLPRAAVDRLSGETFETEEALAEAIAAEVEYVAKLRGDNAAPKVTGQGKTTVVKEAESVEDREAAVAEVLRKELGWTAQAN